MKKEKQVKIKKSIDNYDIVKLLNENILKLDKRNFIENRYEISISGKQFIKLKVTYPLINKDDKEYTYSVVDKITITNDDNNIILPTSYLQIAHYANNSQSVYFYINMLQEKIPYKETYIILNQIFITLKSLNNFLIEELKKEKNKK